MSKLAQFLAWKSVASRLSSVVSALDESVEDVDSAFEELHGRRYKHTDCHDKNADRCADVAETLSEASHTLRYAVDKVREVASEVLKTTDDIRAVSPTSAKYSLYRMPAQKLAQTLAATRKRQEKLSAKLESTKLLIDKEEAKSLGLALDALKEAEVNQRIARLRMHVAKLQEDIASTRRAEVMLAHALTYVRETEAKHELKRFSRVKSQWDNLMDSILEEVDGVVTEDTEARKKAFAILDAIRDHVERETHKLRNRFDKHKSEATSRLHASLLGIVTSHSKTLNECLQQQKEQQDAAFDVMLSVSSASAKLASRHYNLNDALSEAISRYCSTRNRCAVYTLQSACTVWCFALWNAACKLEEMQQKAHLADEEVDAMLLRLRGTIDP